MDMKKKIQSANQQETGFSALRLVIWTGSSVLIPMVPRACYVRDGVHVVSNVRCVRILPGVGTSYLSANSMNVIEMIESTLESMLQRNLRLVPPPLALPKNILHFTSRYLFREEIPSLAILANFHSRLLPTYFVIRHCKLYIFEN